MKALSATYEFEEGNFPRCEIKALTKTIAVGFKGTEPYSNIILFIENIQDLMDFRDSFLDACDKFLRDSSKGKEG